jgi:hypothetical protein
MLPLFYVSVNNVEMFFSYVCLWKTEERKYILNLSLDLVKECCYDFPHPFAGHRNRHVVFKLPLVDTEFEMFGLRPHTLFKIEPLLY